MVGGWTDERDIPEPPKESFRNWWKKHEGKTDERLARDGVPAGSGLQRSGDERAEDSAAASAIPDAPAAEDAAKASRVAETAAGTGDDAATPGAGPDAAAGGQQEATGDPHEDNIDAPNGHAERGNQNGEQA